MLQGKRKRQFQIIAGADPGFLKRGFICINVFVVRFADFIIPMKMKQFGLTETKLFYFHRIFKKGGREGGFKRTP